MTYYRLYMEEPFVSDGRQVKNIGGRVVVFDRGVAARVDESTADAARHLHYIKRVVEITTSTPTPPPAVKEPTTQEPTPQEPTPQEPTPSTDEKFATVEVGAVADVPEIKDGKLYASDILALHESLGTWTAVAEYLDISTTTLRSYRDEAGL